MTLTNFLLLLLIVAIMIGIYWFARYKGLIKRPTAGGDSNGKMSPGRSRFITIYLIVLGVAFIFMELSLLSLDFPETPRVPEPAMIQGPAPPSESQQGGQVNTPSNDAVVPASQNSPTPIPHPVIEYVLPQSTIGSTPNMWLTVYGKNFSQTSIIRLNGRPAAMRNLTPSLMAAQLSAADLVSVGTITIDVIETDDRASNAVIVPVNKPRVLLNVFFVWRPYINREMQLLLLVCFAGALGSYIHALKSATAFIGNRNMGESWFWWYISGPFIGIAMALIFYAVIRGGFLAGTPADEKVVNPFGVVAIGALVGMFADKAAIKLGEIFETLFKSSDSRTNKLDAPVITSLSPNAVQAGQTTAQTVKIIGERLGKVTIIRFNSTEVPATVLSQREVEFTIDPEHLAIPKTLQVIAVDPQAGASISATLTIEGPPQITAPDSLPPATVNNVYSQTVEGVCDPPPCTWSINAGAPAWLTIDSETGQLSGTPNAAGTFSVTIKLEDGISRSAEKTFELTVS